VDTNGQQNGGPLVALDLATGRTLWTKPIGFGSLAYDAGRLFFASYDGSLSAFNAKTGQPLWAVQVPGAYGLTFTPNPVPYKGQIYALGYSTMYKSFSIYQVAEATGAFGWMQNLPALTQAGFGPSIDVADNALIYPGPGSVTSLDLAFGATNWTYSVPTGSCFGAGFAAAVYSGRVFAPGGGCWPGAVLYAKNGNEISELAEGGATDGIAVANKQVVASANFQSLDATNVLTGNLNWSFAIKGVAIGNPIIVNNTVFTFGSNSVLYALDATSGKPVQTFRPKGGLGQSSALAAGEGYVLVLNGGQLTAYTSPH
jgi:outer membrane protein assembly factor BamB